MALVSEFLYQHLLDWLCPAMEAEYKRLYSKGKDGGKLRGLGKYDKNVYQGRVDRLRAIVRNLICEDKMKRFLSDGSKSAIYAFNGVCFVRVEDRVEISLPLPDAIESTVRELAKERWELVAVQQFDWARSKHEVYLFFTKRKSKLTTNNGSIYSTTAKRSFMPF